MVRKDICIIQLQGQDNSHWNEPTSLYRNERQRIGLEAFWTIHSSHWYKRGNENSWEVLVAQYGLHIKSIFGSRCLQRLVALNDQLKVSS